MGMNVNGMCPKFKLTLNGYAHVFLPVQIGTATDLYFRFLLDKWQLALCVAIPYISSGQIGAFVQDFMRR